MIICPERLTSVEITQAISKEESRITKTQDMENVQIFLAVFLFVLFCAVSAFAIDWGQAPGAKAPALEQPAWGQQVHPAQPVQTDCSSPLSFVTSHYLPDAALLQNYQFQFQTTGGVPPITYHVILKTFRPYPPSEDVAMSDSGLLTFKPVKEGKYHFAVVADDSCKDPQTGANQHIGTEFFITVKPPSVSGGANMLKGNVPTINPNMPKSLR